MRRTPGRRDGEEIGEKKKIIDGKDGGKWGTLGKRKGRKMRVRRKQGKLRRRGCKIERQRERMR